MSDRYVIGIDYGTDSVRGVIINTKDGKEVVSSVSYYRRWKEQLYCDPAENRFRQHPLDYVEGLISVVNDCVVRAGNDVRNSIVAISFATTGSTPAPVDETGKPLALLDEFSEDPDAMFNLWKDHTAIDEAEEYNRVAKENGWDYLKYVGGFYSPEWYWAKLLHTIRTNEKVAAAAYTWVEHSDWMSFLLTGKSDAQQIERNVCAAGHKGLWADEFGGLPPKEFFNKVDPRLGKFVDRYGNKAFTTDHVSGIISKEWARKLNLPESVIVGMGAIDAHVGAVGGGIKSHEMTKVMGTSTCDMVIVPVDEMEGVFIKGISGQVNGSIVPDMIGLEAGQAAFGDVYRWFENLLLWPLENAARLTTQPIGEGFKQTAVDIRENLLIILNEEASQLPLDENSEYALDWFNGRRTPDLNPDLKGLIGGLTLGSDPARIYRALVEATCFGSRAILESIEKQGVKIVRVNAIGGIAQKSEFVMQMMADVLNRPVSVVASEQTVALGAAMYAAVAGGVFDQIEKAMETMSSEASKVYHPDVKMVSLYDKRYRKYEEYGK